MTKNIITITDPNHPDFGQTTEIDMPEPPKVPNNPNNPYFGKKPKAVPEFWGHILSVYIVMGGSNEAGADRYARLRNSRRAAAVIDVINTNDVIDPDDKGGDFLRFLAFQLATDHEDGNGKLMTALERDAIMNAWS